MDLGTNEKVVTVINVISVKYDLTWHLVSATEENAFDSPRVLQLLHTQPASSGIQTCEKLFNAPICHTQAVKVQKWVFDSSRGSGHAISCVSHRGVINAGLITARSPDLGKSVWSVRSWLAYPLKKHCNAPPLVSQAEMSECTHLTLTLRTH